MANPTIHFNSPSPPSPPPPATNDWAAATSVTVSTTPYAAFEIALVSIDANEAQCILTVPAGATVKAIRNPANWTAAATTLLAGGVWTTVSAFGDWALTITAGAAATDPATLALSSATNGAGGRLRLIVTGLAGDMTAEPVGDGLIFDRVLAAPSILNAQVTQPVLPVREQDSVKLSASVQYTKVDKPVPVVPVAALPPLLSEWSYDAANTLAKPKNFLPAGANLGFTAPAVYATSVLSFTLRAALDLAANAVFDTVDPFTLQALPVSIEQARYGMVLVLDRSGSMGASLGGGASKWDTAVRAAHAWADLFRAFRPLGNHLAGVVTFENDLGTWVTSSDANVTFRNPTNGAAISGFSPMGPLSGLGTVPTWDLGNQRTSTPIGDALVKAWTAVQTQLTGVGDRGAVVLMTDGFENSGGVTIALTKGAAQDTFQNKRAVLASADQIIGPRLYTIALGTQVDDDRLHKLGNGFYRQITQSVNEVTPAFGEMLGDVLSAEPQKPLSPAPVDNDPHAEALYYAVPNGERILVFLAHWDNVTDALRIGYRDQGSVASFTLIAPGAAVTVTKANTHGMVRIDLVALFGAGANGKEWRFQHVDSVGTARAGLGDVQGPPFVPGRGLVMVDLRTKVDVGFSRTQFFAGEPIGLETRISSGGLAVIGATVLVDSARPGESLGSYLTQNAQKYKNGQGDFPRPKTDPGKGKGLMVQALFQLAGITDLPILRDTGLPLFDDGAHADAAFDDGFYANTFNDTAKEGTYTFRFRIDGTLADGSRFSRVFTRSTWLGLRPDPAGLNPVWTLLTGPDIFPARYRLTITPKYGSEFLGPFRSDVIGIKVFGGQLDGSVLDPEDGTYQWTIISDKARLPTVQISIWGADLDPTAPPAPGGVGPLGTDCSALWWRAISCTWAAIRKWLGIK